MTTKTITTPARKPTIAADTFGSTLTLNFIDGTELSIDIDNLSPQIRIDATLHGLKQKLVDAAAISRNPDTGASATVAGKLDAVREVFERITSADGTWNKVRTGDGSANVGGLLVRALMELKGLDKATVTTFLEGKTKDQIAALKAMAPVAAIIARMQAEKAKDIDADALLGELDVAMGPASDEGNEGDDLSDDEKAELAAHLASEQDALM